MPPPPPLECSVTECLFTTPVGAPTWETMLTLLTTHTQAVHGGGGAPQPAVPNPSRLEKLPRPTFTLKMTESQWSFTKLQWENYIKQTPVSPAIQLMQLQAACDGALQQRIFDTGTYAALTTVDPFLAKMKELAVIVVHKSIHLMNLWKMTQQSDEPIRAFAARLTATADMCGMVTKCPNQTCGNDVSFRDLVVHQMVIHGIRDNNVRVRVLSRNTSGELTTLDKLIDYIAAEEAGAAEASDLVSDSHLLGGIRRKSSYSQQKSYGQQQQSYGQQQQKCKNCGEPKHSQTNSPDDRKQKCKAWGKTCSKCQKLHHLANVCMSAKTAPILIDKEADNNTGEVNSISVSNFFSIESNTVDDGQYNIAADVESRRNVSTPSSDGKVSKRWTFSTGARLPTSPQDILPILAYLRTNDGPVTTLPLPHHVHEAVSGWHPSRPKDSPTITAQFSLDRPSYAQLGLNLPRFRHAGSNFGRSTDKPSICDTGAQLMVVPTSMLDSLNIKPDSIFPLETTINGASEVPIMVEGGLLLKVTARNSHTGAVRYSHQLAYVSKHVRSVYLSLTACIDLDLVPRNFPEVGSCNTTDPASVCPVTSPMPQPCINDGVVDSPCSCPTRQLPPPSQPQLPCSPTRDNLPTLKQYILQRYSSSAFNCCEKQTLPLMDSSPPLRIFVDENATPVAVHTPCQVPLHWQTEVKRGLDRDCQLGVLEKVPVNDPVTWCSRMVITPKQDGSPRRVVDFTPLNRCAPRQTHHTQTPWSLVSSIPSNKVKSTLDCWNGYHSVPLHPADRHLTTFITPWGRFRYRTSPQGLVSAGDSYTHRKAEIMHNFENVKDCVDDSLIYDDTIEDNFYRVCAYLDQGARGGCTFNPKKFQFGEEEVQFLGFLVTNTGVKPTPAFVNSILSFPTPKTLTDIRSWFGAINQISYSFAIAPTMSPFRHLLSSKVPFQWTAELQTAFDESKQEILRQCAHGVRSFDPSLPTALATDWSKLGIGYWLTQRHCSCPGEPKPGCCQSGWQTVYCGSRFCSPAESRYHPIEGEALASVVGLDKCKFFILGLNDLTLCVDHKPLLAILGDRQELAEIPNPRLLNFKLKSLMYRYKLRHIPGKQHVIPDTFSRRQDSPIKTLSNTTTVPKSEEIMMSNIMPSYSDSLGPPSWVSTPTVSSITLAPTPQEAKSATELDDLLTGIILACLEDVNRHSFLTPLTSPSQPTVLSWARLEAGCLSCDNYKLLHNTVQSGVSDQKENWDERIKDFYQQRHSLTNVGPVVMLHDRPVIPQSLRQNVLEHLHAGHASATAMFERAATSLYWPNLRADMINFRAACSTCTRYAPSNPAMPPTEPEQPTYPFQSVCADFFHISPHNYLAVVDRYSQWLSIFQLPQDNSEEIVKVLRDYISIFGIPCTLTSDGASVFTSKYMESFCDRWGIIHRVATAYNPQANKRAEVGVKSAKRLVRGNLTQTGSLQTDKLARALLAHRNTPCPVSGLSPAQIVYGRVLRDFLPLQPSKFQPRQEWRQSAADRAAAYAKRHITKGEQMSHNSKPLQPLQPGDQVAIQNQRGKNPRQWQETGVVIEVGPHHSYHVSIDGSRTVTKRNRQFLRKITPFQNLTCSPTSPSHPTYTYHSPPKTNLVPPPHHGDNQPTNHGQQPALHHQHDDVGHQTVATDHVTADQQTGTTDQVEPRDDGTIVLPLPPSTVPPTSPAPSPPTKARQLPPHLRERWIVADPKVPAGAMAPVQHVPHPYQTYPVPPVGVPYVAQIYAGHAQSHQTYPVHSWPMMHHDVALPNLRVLPYMMPQQDMYVPVMNNFSSSQ